MEPQEKKYHVDSFDNIEKKLKEIGAPEIRKVVSTHYYGQHDSNDVEKFVEYSDRVEIHILKESVGKFTMTEHKGIPDKEAGFAWLKERGYRTANIVKMAYTEYAYKDGTIGLYVIDDFLRSVILYYQPSQHATVEKEFGLDNAEVITVPYNKYLKQMERLRSINL